MKTKIFFLFIILFFSSYIVKAQLEGKKFKVTVGEMGTFNLEFEENTFVLSSADGNVLVKGEYQTEDNILVFVDKEGPIACQPGNIGKYKYVFENKQLKLELLEENCPGRKALATNPWTLLEE